jgi:hypothetical protein
MLVDIMVDMEMEITIITEQVAAEVLVAQVEMDTIMMVVMVELDIYLTYQGQTTDMELVGGDLLIIITVVMELIGIMHMEEMEEDKITATEAAEQTESLLLDITYHHE